MEERNCVWHDDEPLVVCKKCNRQREMGIWVKLDHQAFWRNMAKVNEDKFLE